MMCACSTICQLAVIANSCELRQSRLDKFWYSQGAHNWEAVLSSIQSSMPAVVVISQHNNAVQSKARGALVFCRNGETYRNSFTIRSIITRVSTELNDMAKRGPECDTMESSMERF